MTIELLTIPEFFREKVLLITGSTGFLCRLLVAKILTDLPDVTRVYLLIRPKGNSSAKQRLQEILESDAFDALREEIGEEIFWSLVDEKLVAVEGDTAQEQWGLTDMCYTALQNEVDVVIHGAASTDFGAELDVVRTNTLAAQYGVEFAQGCKDAILVHISTTFRCQSQTGGRIEESLKPTYQELVRRKAKEGLEIPPTLEDEIAAMLQRHGELEQEDSIQKKRKNGSSLSSKSARKWAMARGWNDIYAYTKWLAEQVIARHRGDLSVVIIRPSIIESSHHDPVPGWIGGPPRMVEPIMIAFADGKLPDLPADPEIRLDLIPADFVVNAILAATKRISELLGLEIYHVSSGWENPLEFGELVQFVREGLIELNRQGWNFSRLPVWKFRSWQKFQRSFSRKRTVLSIAKVITAFVGFKKHARFFGKLVHDINRLLFLVEIYLPYMTHDFVFVSDNTRNLFNGLAPPDKEDFRFDLGGFAWENYIKQTYVPAVMMKHLPHRRAKEVN